MKKTILLSFVLFGFLTAALAQDSTAYQILKKPPGEGNEAEGTFLEVFTPVGSSLRLDSNFAIDCWVYLDSATALGTKAIASAQGVSGGFEFAAVDKVLWLTLYQENGTDVAIRFNNGPEIPTNQWTHVAVTYTINGSRAQAPTREFYVNGVLAGTQGIIKLRDAILYANENNHLYIGKYAVGNAPSTFIIDNLRIWGEERSLTIPQVWDSCVTGPQNGLLAMYDFEGVTAAGVADGSGNGNTATFYSFKESSVVDGAISCGSNTNSINQKSTKQFRVYPNPTSGVITINTDQPIEQIQVLNLAGQVLRTFTQTNNQINVADLTPGVYLLQVEEQDGIGYSRFIKN